MHIPPALDAFKRTRDETEIAFRRNPASFDLFHDLASMNDRLGDGRLTADLFTEIAEIDHASAQDLYHVAEPCLIAAGQFHACCPFLNPKKRIELATDRYHMTKRFEESRPQRDIPLPSIARTHFIRNIATLVGLLVLNDRAEEARTVYNDALGIMDDDEFRTTMDAAMTGHFPERRAR